MQAALLHIKRQLTKKYFKFILCLNFLRIAAIADTSDGTVTCQNHESATSFLCRNRRWPAETFLVCKTIFRLDLAELNKFIVKFNQLLSLKLKIKFISPSSSSRSRKMFIGGLSWQTSPGMFTSDIDFFQSVLIQMASKYEKFIGPKLKH